MRALVLADSGVRLESDRPDPMPAAGEVLVRVTRAGVCQTDLQLVKGYHGFRGVLGHEFTGVALGGTLQGQRVVGEINCSCWTCATCLAGRSGHCPNRSVIGILGHDGAFADLVAVPERNLHAVPDALDDDVAVFTEPVAAAFQIPAQVVVGRDDVVVILGDGRLGNVCAQVLASLSDRVIVIGRHRAKLELLAALGIEAVHVDDAHASGLPPADTVVDCTGSPAGLSTALELVRPRGTVVLKTTVAREHTVSLAPAVVNEVTLVGSRCGPFDRALDALANGLVDVRPLIAARFPLSDAAAALDHAGQPGILKVLIEP